MKIPAGQDVSTDQMQTIAREFNLSETLFLHEGQTGDDGIPTWRVRIFVTNAEIPFAGHPTIGASCYALGTLANNAPKGRLLCNAGTIKVDYAEGVAKASIPQEFHVHTQHPLSKEDIYGIHPSLKTASKEPTTWDVVSPVKGMNFVCIELPDLEMLGTIDTSGPEPKPRLDDRWNVGLCGSYPYVITDSGAGLVKLRTRMMMGALEDPATGSAACALSMLLAMKSKECQTTRFEITQAIEMKRRSEIGVEVTLHREIDVDEVILSGTAVKVMEGTVEYD